MLEQVTDQKGWNDWVLRHGGSFLQSWEWGTFQERAGFAVRRLRDTASGSLALLAKRRLPLGRSYWYCPRGPLDPAMADALRADAALDGADFLRIEPQVKNSSADAKVTKPVQPAQTLILDITKPEAELLSAMHEKTRYNIRLAERKGVAAYEVSGKDPNAFGVFADLLKETAERDGFSGHEAEYYRKMLETLNGDPSDRDDRRAKAKMFFAQHDGKVIAANLMVFFGDTAIYLHGASSNMRRETMAPHLLHWTCIKKAKEWGYANYDFWGVAPKGAENHPWAGISRFKHGFGGTYVEYPGACDLVRNSFWYRLYALVKRSKG